MPRNNKIQIRKGSSSEWVSANPVLGSGEPGFDLGNNILKIGDGSKYWNQLNPIGGGDLSVLSEEPNGFVNKDHSAISVNFSNVGSIGSGIFTISPTGGVSSYDVFIKGIKYNYGSLTGYIPDSTNLYFVYIDKSDKILKVKNTNPDFATDISVSYVYWNTDNNQVVYQAEERHGIKMDSATHLYLHRVFGAQYISGLGLTYNSLIGNGSTDIDAKIAISDGLIFDEDDQINISHSSNPNINNYEQILSPTGQIPIFYKDGAAGGWKYSGPTNYPVKIGASAQYNQYTGGSWTTTNAGNSKFIATWIVATNNMLYPIIGIMGQEVDDNIGQADIGNLWENLDLTSLPIVEMRPLYRLIFETDSRWSSNSSRAALRDVKDIRSVLNVTGGGLSPSDHGNLFGLLDDDHSQYLHVDNNRTVNAIHDFVNGLTVNGTGVSISGHTHTASNISNFNSSVSGLLPVGTLNYVSKFGTGGSGLSDSLIFDNGTNVGVGTSSPAATLEINGPLKFTNCDTRIMRLDNSNIAISGGSNNTGHFGLYIDNRATAAGRSYRLASYTDGTNGSFRIRDDSAGADRLIISSNGNVGIGTTIPNELLEVSGNIRLSDTGTSTGHRLQLARGGGAAYDYTLSKEGNHLAISTSNDTINTRAVQIGSHTSTTWTPKIHLNGWTGAVGINNTFASVQPSMLVVRGSGNSSATSTVNFTNSSNTSLFSVRDDGMVGIGTTTPSGQLHVIGTGIFSSRLSVGANTTTVNATNYNSFFNGNICVGSGDAVRTISILGNNSTKSMILKSHGGNSYLTYGIGSQNLGLGDSDVGGNPFLNINHYAGSTPGSGTGHKFYTKSPNFGGYYDVIINSSGWMGIGSGIIPQAALHVVGDVLATGSFIGGSGTALLPSFEFTGDPDTGLFSPAENTFGISTSGVERLRVNDIGNVGIGASPQAGFKLDVAGSTIIRGSVQSNNIFLGYATDYSAVRYQFSNSLAGGGANRSWVCNGGGTFGVGFTAPSGLVAISGGVSIGSNYNLTPPTNGLIVEGNVGIGTTTPTYKLEVNGSFAASTKSFRIHHPSKKDHSLEYGSLESPYHGVRLTGRDKAIKGVGVVSVPDYLKDLIHDDDTLNIQITNIKHGKTIYIDKIDLKNDRFIVKADRSKTLGNLEFFWTLTGVRKDVDHLVVEKRN